ncbi:MAG: GTPase Era [Gammaproteobacteria bacterium]
MTNKHSGYVALIGRPNVGKSTLLNRILGQKLSITSRKPQTTRHRILGIKTEGDTQWVYVDTPGLHRGSDRKINHFMNRAAISAIGDVDVICFIVDGIHFNEGDAWALKQVKRADKPTILVINKTDTLEDKDILLPHIEQLMLEYPFKAVVPISAKSGKQVDVLEQAIKDLLPLADFFYFPEDALSDRDERFRASEIIREKLMRTLGEELPYEVHVMVDSLKKEEKIINVSATLLVAREGQKAIVIGKGGERLKSIGMAARLDMEKIWGKPVMLRLWVKVKERWADDESQLKKWGYDE